MQKENKNYLKLEDLVRLLGITKQGIYYRMKCQNFPKPVKVVNRFKYWDVQEIKEYYSEFGYKFTLSKGLQEK
jgi:predicted DNA-binding transcriptional regulator AlpA